ARSLLGMEGFAVHEAWLNESPHLYGVSTRGRLLQGAFFSAADYQHAQRLRTKLAEELLAITAGVDVIVTASSYDAVPRIDDAQASARRHLHHLYTPFNVTGQPALVMPVKVSQGSGMPLSIQIAAAPFEEARIYRVAHYLEEALDTRR